jgi:hypothetical protein
MAEYSQIQLCRDKLAISNGCFKSPTVYNCNNVAVPAANYFNINQNACALCLTSTPP